MDLTFINTLDKQTGRYVREALSDTDTDNNVRAQLADVTKQAAKVAQDVEAGASPDDALTFKRELDRFLAEAKTKALEAHRIETTIEEKLREVAKTQAEIDELSASLPALVAAVNQTLGRYEEARYDHSTQEFKIATLSTRLSMRRGEMAELRRQLDKLIKSKEERN
jgi:uncharacterized coiled-coil protein SlyX